MWGLSNHANLAYFAWKLASCVAKVRRLWLCVELCDHVIAFFWRNCKETTAYIIVNVLQFSIVSNQILYMKRQIQPLNLSMLTWQHDRFNSAHSCTIFYLLLEQRANQLCHSVKTWFKQTLVGVFLLHYVSPRLCSLRCCWPLAEPCFWPFCLSHECSHGQRHARSCQEFNTAPLIFRKHIQQQTA